MSLIDEQAAFLKDTRRLLEFAEAQNYLVTGGELERSLETQSLYMRMGLETSMDSPHLRKCAATFNFFKVSDKDHYELVQNPIALEPVGKFWEELDPRNRWGGRLPNYANANRFVRDLGGWQPVDRTEAPPAEAVALADDRPSAVVLPPAVPTTSMPVLRAGSTDRDSVSRLQGLLVKAGIELEVNGIYNDATNQAVITFQKNHDLVADGIVGEKTWTLLCAPASDTPEAITPRFIGDADFVAAATKVGLELAVIKAVYKVESNGKGFIGDKPKILFEGHVFWKQLKQAGLRPEDYVKGNEDILYPAWTKQFYVGGSGEHQRLERAEHIHKEAARASASWGLFQIMGFHWQTLGYASVNEFVELMSRHERDQLDAFCRFIGIKKDKSGKPLVELLQQEEKDWSGFAYAYNGPAYRKNAYDDKLKEYYRQFSAA